MKVLVTGGTGSIGGAVVDVLLARGHEVYALARTPEAGKSLDQRGAVPVSGDLLDPAGWVDACDGVDGVVHAAAVWGDQMGRIDSKVVDAILDRLRSGRADRPFVYTGGCWLYGATAEVVATEDSPFDSPDSFAWAIPVIQKVLSAERVKGMVIHPAMVYERNGGVFEHIFEDARNLGYARVLGGENVRWPLVHRIDLAQLYALMLEKGEQGDVYNAATNHGVPIGKLTRAIALRLGLSSELVICDIDTAMVEIGSWAEGYAIDQQMSGEKARQRLGWCPRYEDVFAEIQCLQANQ